MEGVPIRSVCRSISVLQVINSHGPLPLMDIARIGNLPYPTVFRIVQTLVHEGLVEQEPTSKTYRPTALVESLAHGYRSDGPLSEASREPIAALTRDIGWPVFVSVRVGQRMVVRESTHAQTSMTFEPCNPGVTIPLLSSTTGRAYLSALPMARVHAILDSAERNRWGLDPNFEREAFLARLEQIRARGVSAAPYTSREANRTASIAVPIVADGEVEATLTLTYFFNAMNEQTAIARYADRLHAVATRISDRLECRAVAA
ncbi:IclR family transcriptional regulator [Novosphingobium mangrovi (ex Hu et al. 2023)]|uniref:Helix-turn-helix domain-containing protein n=1 Tax=Novosphingobium mangrovi (ex Hu et al. 2023) TaxID=2930094 RepID=A0ABT0AEE2_9SPHN|nr:IclR family transcriptional regulator C-terminal domain-containing protein [Novosphingobium mangrovi (ex Hu et al. 2023)]MCJ1961534.1 helix-turn-helix domain-containing protein [Novosphingobium mangrovi (ex Hu et al. 2023)]